MFLIYFIFLSTYDTVFNKLKKTGCLNSKEKKFDISLSLYFPITFGNEWLRIEILQTIEMIIISSHCVESTLFFLKEYKCVRQHSNAIWIIKQNHLRSFWTCTVASVNAMNSIRNFMCNMCGIQNAFNELFAFLELGIQQECANSLYPTMVYHKN